MNAISNLTMDSIGDRMDGASYGDLRQTVNELSAVSGLSCACFDSAGRCFIRSEPEFGELSAESLWEFPFFSEFSRSVLQNRTGRQTGFLYRDESGCEYLAAPLFLGEHYWGGVYLERPYPARGTGHGMDNDDFLTFAEDILTVYAAAMQENIQAFYERMDLMRHLRDWYPMENWIRERRSALCRLWGEKLAYQTDPGFVRDSVNALHSLAVMEENREIEKKYELTVQMLRMYRHGKGKKRTMREEADFFTLYRDCLSSFCDRTAALSLLFDEEAGGCIIPAFSLFRIAESVIEEFSRLGRAWEVSVQTERNTDRVTVSVRGRQEAEDDARDDRWFAYHMLFNHDGVPIANMPIPACMKAVRELKEHFREKMVMSFTASDYGTICIQLAFPYQSG